MVKLDTRSQTSDTELFIGLLEEHLQHIQQSIFLPIEDALCLLWNVSLQYVLVSDVSFAPSRSH